MNNFSDLHSEHIGLELLEWTNSPVGPRSVVSLGFPLLSGGAKQGGGYTRNQHIPTNLISERSKTRGVYTRGAVNTRNTPDLILKG